MMEQSDINIIKSQPYILHRHGFIQEVNDRFLLLTGYERKDFIGKELLYVLNDLLKISKVVESATLLADMTNCFFFNKLMDFKEADIEVYHCEPGEASYLVFKQQPLISINNPISYTEQLLSDNLSGIAIYSAEDYTLLKANREYEKLMASRTTQKQLIGKRISDFYIGWQDSIAKKTWEEAIKNKKTAVSLEHMIVSPVTGQEEYFDASATPVMNDGKVKFLVVSVNNITEKVNYRKESETKAKLLKKQKELLGKVIDKQKDAIYIIDRNYNILVSNETIKQRYGLREIASVMDITNAAEFFDEADNPLSFEQLPAYLLMHGESVEDLKVKMKQGDKLRYLNLNGAAIYGEDDKIEHAFLCGTDITEMVESRQQLVSQKEQLEAIMDNMSDVIFIIDKNERFIMKNNAALSFFGEKVQVLQDTFKNTNYYKLDGTAMRYEDTPVHRMLRGEIVSDEVVFMKGPTLERYMSFNANPIFDEDSKVKMGVISGRDITEYMRNEILIRAQQRALLDAEKKEKENLEKIIVMKDDFLSLVSHEFKTPLTVINSALQAMEFLYKDQLTDNVKNYLNKIKQNTFRQVRLVNNLLDITGANAGHIKLNPKNRDIVFISKMLVESVALYANQKGVQLYFQSDCTQKNIYLDEEKFERILLNLLSNAIKFTPKDKSITVDLKCAADKVFVSVIDEGIGIPEEKHELIFERFGQVDSSYTRQAEGSGIGLSLVKLIVNAMGGNIRVKSQLGAGSRFVVELPDIIEKEAPMAQPDKKLIDDRLVQSIAIEFSDIYF